MPLVWRIIGLMLGAVIGGAALTAAVQSLYADRLYADLAQSRFNFVLQGLKSAVEFNVGLGFPLSELRQAQDLLEREKAADPQILAIELLDEAGRTLFSTDRGTTGEDPPQAWAAAIADARGKGWRAPERDVVAEATPLVNDFEKTIGYVVLSYAPEHYYSRAAALSRAVAAAAAAAAVVAGVIAAAAAAALTRRRLKPLSQVAALFAPPHKAGPRPAPNGAPDAAPRSARASDVAPLLTAAHHARAAIIAADADVEQAGAALARLEEEL